MGRYNIETLIECMEARKRTITESLRNRETNTQDFTEWRFYSKEELEGRYAEIINILGMMDA